MLSGFCRQPAPRRRGIFGRKIMADRVSAGFGCDPETVAFFNRVIAGDGKKRSSRSGCSQPLAHQRSNREPCGFIPPPRSGKLPGMEWERPDKADRRRQPPPDDSQKTSRKEAKFELIFGMSFSKGTTACHFIFRYGTRFCETIKNLKRFY